MKVKCNIPNIYDNYSETLLQYYGVDNVDYYINPDREALSEPTLLNNIEEGYELYKRVCDANGKILLIVDCDVDGYTSSAIFYQYTKLLYPNIQISYLLHRGKAHGLEDHIGWIEKNPVFDLVVCPDSSSNDFEYHERLKILGIPCLVIDHHITDVEISDNAVVINNQLSPNYPNPDNTGAGLVYQFCRYLDTKYNVHYADRFIDLAALGIDGDMGDLRNVENRYILKKGFATIQNFFFRVLIDKQSYSMGGTTTPISVAFYIVPLINAMIRVGTHAEKERLFLAFIDGEQMVTSNKRGAKGSLEMVAIESARECTNARNHQNKFKEEMVLQLDQKIQQEGLLDNKILFVRLDDDMDFPSELNGLVCMQLSAKYKKPTLLGRENYNGEIKGSIRGLSNSELSDFRGFLADTGLFEYVQGHPNAAGYCLLANNYNSFIQYANEALKDIDFNNNCYDVQFVREGNAGDIEKIIYDIASHEDIWGTGLPEPLFYIKNLRIRPSDIRIMGKNQDTIKIVYNGVSYLKFHAKDMIEELGNYNDEFTLEVIGRGNVNEWMGRKSGQIVIESYEIKQSSILDF